MSARRHGLVAVLLCLAAVSLGAEPHGPPSPLVPNVLPSPPIKPQPVEETTGKLSPLDHLRAAAEQLEAAGMAEEAAQLRETADHVSRRITKERAEIARRISELQNRSAQLQRLGGAADKIVCRCCFVELSAKAAAEFESAAERVGSSDGSENLTAPMISVYRNAEATLQKLKESGQVTILAEPRIVTVSGQPATLKTDGRFPIPVPDAAGKTSVEWRHFGVSCQVEPRVLDSGKLRLKFAPEISHRDFSRSVIVDGHTVPGLTTRRVFTQAEMNFGETLVVRTASNAESRGESSLSTWLKTVAQWANAEVEAARPENTVTLLMVTPAATD